MSSFSDLSPAEQATILHEITVSDMTSAIVVCCFGAAMVPVFVICILFSTPRTRRQPVFWIQMLALVMAMTAASLEVAAYYIDVLYPAKRIKLYSQLLAAKEVLKWLVPPLTDTALIFRLLAFYPQQLASWRKRALVVGFPVLIKIPRLTAINVNLVYAVKDWIGPRVGWPQGLKWQCVECVLQVFDNTYVSVFILARTYRSLHASLLLGNPSARLQRSVRLLLEAVTMSFAPAVLVQIALALSMAVPLASNQLVALNDVQSYLFTTNVYVSLMFSLLATSWSSICNTSAAQHITAHSHRRLRFDRERTKAEKPKLASAGANSSPTCSGGSTGTAHLNSSHPPSLGSTGSHTTSATRIWEQNSSGLGSMARLFPHASRRQRLLEDTNIEAGRSTLMARRGIEPPSQGEDRTLLHFLVGDDELEANVAGFYFADDEDHKGDCGSNVLPGADPQAGKVSDAAAQHA